MDTRINAIQGKVTITKASLLFWPLSCKH